MYNEIINNLEKQLNMEKMSEFKNKVIHLGLFCEPCLTYMLDGKKTIESRFSKNKIIPYEKITKDDIVLIKKSSGPILGYFTIKEVLFFDLKIKSIHEIKENYGKGLCVTNEFWDKKKDSNYGTLIFIDKLVRLEPFYIKKSGMQSWIILDNK